MKEVIDGRSYSHEVLEHYRFRAIELHNEGRKINDIAHFFGVHRGSVSRWVTTHKREGKKALRSRKAPGPSHKLSIKEMSILLSALEEDALQYGFETPLWTCKRVQQIIRKNHKKRLHTTNIMRWLKKLNYTNQKPTRRAIERDDVAVQRWLSEEWPKIKAHARRWQAMLYFQDEAGVSLTAVMGKTWAPKGSKPIVKVSGNRGGFTLTSAISPAGRMVFRIEKKRVNAEKHIEFLQKILDHHPHRKIIVIEDRAPPHTAKKVERFVEENKKRLAVYYLPSYCPELNPDEHVWEYLKAYQLKAHQAQNTEQLKKVVKRKMQSIQRKPSIINSFFLNTYVT